MLTSHAPAIFTHPFGSFGISGGVQKVSECLSVLVHLEDKGMVTHFRFSVRHGGMGLGMRADQGVILQADSVSDGTQCLFNGRLPDPANVAGFPFIGQQFKARIADGLTSGSGWTMIAGASRTS
jgi:hypothetical protein